MMAGAACDFGTYDLLVCFALGRAPKRNIINQFYFPCDITSEYTRKGDLSAYDATFMVNGYLHTYRSFLLKFTKNHSRAFFL